jgi:hypothetical protein
MDRYELDNLLRSIAMLTPRVMALDREQALRILDELAAMKVELERLKRALHELMAGIETVEDAWRGR